MEGRQFRHHQISTKQKYSQQNGRKKMQKDDSMITGYSSTKWWGEHSVHISDSTYTISKKYGKFEQSNTYKK